MMRLKALASGSNGNCIYIDNEDTRILIDAGISCRRIREGVSALGTEAKDLNGVLITHEHSDHIQGLKILAKTCHVPIYGTYETLDYIREHDVNDEIPMELYHPVHPGNRFSIGSLDVLPISTFHDAVNPVCYRVENGKNAVAVVTDTGSFSESMVDSLEGLDGLLLEANHDIRMLEAGSYPYVLKRRILSDYGHLSNERSGELLCRLLNSNMKFCLLGHLSEENNYPDLALMSVKNEVDLSDVPYSSADIVIDAATRYEPSALYEL